jgi:uncharacterized integral membrane protein
MLSDKLYEAIHSSRNLGKCLGSCFSHTPAYYTSPAKEPPEPAVRKKTKRWWTGDIADTIEAVLLVYIAVNNSCIWCMYITYRNQWTVIILPLFLAVVNSFISSASSFDHLGGRALGILPPKIASL